MAGSAAPGWLAGPATGTKEEVVCGMAAPGTRACPALGTGAETGAEALALGAGAAEAAGLSPASLGVAIRVDPFGGPDAEAPSATLSFFTAAKSLSVLEG